jgi:hypothetical protein
MPGTLVPVRPRGNVVLSTSRMQEFVAAAVANPVAYPLDPPTLNGAQITVDMYLQQPTRVTRMIRDLTLQRFFVDRVFTNAGGVTGGAVVYDEATDNELYLERDVERVAPGAEMPVVTSVRNVPKVAEVEKWGGKFFFTDEARDRNQLTGFANKVRQLANTIVRKVNQRGVAVLEDAITAQSGATTMTGHNWGTVVTGGSSQTNNSGWPAADFANAQLVADQKELGYVFDTWITNPAQLTALKIVYGEKLPGVLDANGIREVYATNRVAAGTAYAVAAGQVGEMRVEQPLGTETSREGAPLLRQRTWVQSSVRPVMYVTDPFAVLKVTGLAG